MEKKQTLWGIIKTVSFFTTVAFIGFLLAGKLEFSTKKIVLPVDCNQVCMDYSDTAKYQSYPLLNGRLLDVMARLYQTQRRVGQLSINSSNSQSAWFSLDDLKRFLWEIETKVCNNPCSNLKTSDLGVRIYYAQYPDSVRYRQLTNGWALQKRYEGLNTVFMVPTYNSLSNDPLSNDFIHTDFMLNEDFLNKKCLPAPVPPVTVDGADFTIRALFLPALPDGKNHGDLCPPVCEGGAFHH